MTQLTRRAVLAAAAMIPTAALAQTKSPSDAYLYIIWPNDGQRIKGAFWCRFGLRNMGIARAGDRTPDAGHHHLFVDIDESVKPGAVIPADRITFISVPDRARRASTCRPAATPCSSCSVTPNTRCSIRRSCRRRSA